MKLRLDEVDSTNEYAKRLIADGWSSEELSVVTAQYQTAGKGRRGRQWVSPPGTSLILSMFFKSGVDNDKCPMITLLAALAVRDAFAGFGIETDIKWPNDIIIGGRKLCGILTEAIPDKEYLIVGIGINLTCDSWPEELADKATSVLMATGDCVDEDALLDAIVEAMDGYLTDFRESGDLSGLVDTYNEALVSVGKQVTVENPQGAYDGICEGINSRGEMLVRGENGEVTTVYAGEVSVQGVYGYDKEK